MGHDSFFSIETIDKINKENIKGIKLKNETTYVSLPNPTILITTTSTPERQFSISVLDDDKDRKSTRLNSSHIQKSRMPSSA